MDSGSLTFSTFGLGSTVGLLVIAGIGLSNSGAPYGFNFSLGVAVENVLLALDCVSLSCACVKLEKAWKEVAEVVKKYNDELVDQWNKEIDGLLTFVSDHGSLRTRVQQLQSSDLISYRPDSSQPS